MLNLTTHHRTHTCGELSHADINKEVTLCGWVQRVRDKGGMLWIDVRDRYGVIQIVLEESSTEINCMQNAKSLGREYVIKVTGVVKERMSKNPKMKTGDIEIIPTTIEVLNPSQVPPFTIEDNTDGGDNLRMKYRYLDIRRNPVKHNLEFRHNVSHQIRNYMDEQNFVEVETPVLIKSTPEGARDFIVPSRVNPGEFYALPQSPQTFKQLLMVAGLDRYYQIVKCFRDEDLRADRQPEFTQLDCEMSFVTQQDILQTFSGLVKHLFKNIKGIEISEIPLMTYQEAMHSYGSDKPDLRFDMKLVDLTTQLKGKGFLVFDSAEWIGGICAKGCAIYTRKQIDELIEFVKKPQIGAGGLVYVRYNSDGTVKSSVDKFYTEDELKKVTELFKAAPGDLLLILCGKEKHTRKCLNELRLEMGNRLGLRKSDEYKPVWIIDFPLLEWNEEEKRFYAMHHPFTSPKTEDIPLLDSQPEKVRAIAHDLVINGTEIGGGSIRIHQKELQEKIFHVLGFTKEEANEKFGFLMNAFEFGAPPHGGIAFGFDRWVALLCGSETIRDFIAFPKNNAGRDVMIDSPSPLPDVQLKELGISIQKNNT
ncbi:MAG: aspartate--tRNA ligase [Bacteroidetes bacterium RIFCSPLOWO2_02_FULL_36_8]|nr:MAG: aspartate--tRNA ligase [Bacteroidetes bacterium RIFCSPLOWO2_02_FULL_36_8]OFY70611.1 MAG: aspartate--tRNA ligase [Bacteroidetes bacterium RIFCSPLOWO2_12_FULL_37_12]